MISVIIPAYNNLEEILRCINSVRSTATQEVEIIVSDDSTKIDLTELIPPVLAKVVRPPERLGFAGNCNYGAAAATGDILFFVNQDIEVLPDGGDWVRCLSEALHFKQIGMWAPMLLFPDGRIQNGGGFFDGRRQPTHFALGWENLSSHRVSSRRSVTWTTGAAVGIRASTFAEVNGFDTSYIGGYFEDVDLCMKVRKLGYEIAFDPFARMVHKVGTSGGNPNFVANAKLFFDRWHDSDLTKPETTSVYQGWW
jgi:O-antigen biosynthesis protein